jgi:hypothetical protein
MSKLKMLTAVALSGFMLNTSAASFYIAAHPDDIELFMARNAAYDVWSGAKVIFIVVSAGDKVFDSQGNLVSSGWTPFPFNPPVAGADPYPLAREYGHHAALLSWYTLRGVPGAAQSESYITIAGKQIRRTLIGAPSSNIIMYNLRLPDQYSATISNSAVTAIGPAPAPSYSLPQLQSVINGIIAVEHDGDDSWVNIQDSIASPSIDHIDHINTAIYVKNALQAYAASNPTYCVRTIEWRGYSTKTEAINYTSGEQQWQLNSWNALNDSMVAHGGPDTREPGHTQYLYKIYQNNAGIGTYGPCN